MSTRTAATGSSAIQGPLWGARAEDWAGIQEPLSLPIYRRLIELAGVREGTTVLDAGCGSGHFARAVADAGAHVAGLDAAGAW
jgi:2-polyprenyl-3-methyl-5-hydroxy-6-metoxy-1,4-benzoquinol methylase